MCTLGTKGEIGLADGYGVHNPSFLDPRTINDFARKGKPKRDAKRKWDPHGAHTQNKRNKYCHMWRVKGAINYEIRLIVYTN